MGGVHVEEALRILEGSATRYLPFAGKPSGHPTRLADRRRRIKAQCRTFAAMGCAGVDILAYRATEAEPLDLVAACRRGFPDFRVRSWSPDRSIRPNASTPSAPQARTPSRSARRRSASYAPGAGPLAAQLRAVLEDCGGPHIFEFEALQRWRSANLPSTTPGADTGSALQVTCARPAPRPLRRTLPAPRFSLSAWRIKSCWLLGAMPPFGGSRSRLVGKA